MSDSHHFQIEPEPAKEALFRVGGVYRQKNGALVRLSDTYQHGCGPVQAGWAQAQFVERESHDGIRDLATGHYVSGESSISLIPGELIERDGKWVPAATIGPFPSGATLTISGDKVVGRTEPAECIEDLLAYAHALATAVPAEPQRAPLPDSDAWRYTGKERDDFPEFVVTRETVIDFALPLNKPMPKGGTLHAHPGVGSALLRG